MYIQLHKNLKFRKICNNLRIWFLTSNLGCSVPTYEPHIWGLNGCGMAKSGTIFFSPKLFKTLLQTMSICTDSEYVNMVEFVPAVMNLRVS
jgi:hypothetical protein